MSKRESYESQAEALLQPIVDRLGFELVDVEYVRGKYLVSAGLRG